MALIKSVELENGATGEYWKIIKVDIDFLEKRAEIWFGLLKDKSFNDEKYDKGNTNSVLLLNTKRITFNFENFPFTKEALEGENIKAVAYSASKQSDEFFSDSIDG